MPASSAASRTVTPLGASIFLPSMVKVMVAIFFSPSVVKAIVVIGVSYLAIK
jgi:hypothetical protein